MDNQRKKSPKGKRSKITSENERQIVRYATEQYPEMPRRALAEKLQREIKWEGPAPELEVLERKISSYRRHSTDNHLDEPWSLSYLVQNDLPVGRLREHDIPAEVIPLILDMQEERRSHQEKPLTIREVFWASKLYCTIKTPRTTYFLFMNTATSLLYQWAHLYASEEQISEITGIPFDTSNLDRIIAKYPEEYVLNPLYWDNLQMQEGFDEAARKMSEIYEALITFQELVKKYPNHKGDFSESDEALYRKTWNLIGCYVQDSLKIPDVENFFSNAAARLRVELRSPAVATLLMHRQSKFDRSDSVDTKKEARRERPHRKEG